MNPHIFREYDIRGVVERDLDPVTVRSLGRAFASRIAERGGRRVAVGMDVRTTSPGLAAALVEGITAGGIDVVRIGVAPTPELYFAVHHLDLDGGVQVTGSHNPIEYNGFKMMEGRDSLWGEAIGDLRRRMEAGEPPPARTGKVEDRTLDEAYLEAIARGTRPPRPLRLVLDAGNGCAGLLAPRLFRRLGCEVECLYCEPDGTFPNHIPDPTLPSTLTVLRERVRAGGADLGIAYDGDADRLGALDETGRIAWGDQLLALFARDVLARSPGSPILFEVKCSRALAEDVEAHGGRPVMTKTGHSLIKAAMKETNAPVAGEMSGHMFFADEWYGFDDALYASARLVRLVAGSEAGLGALLDSLPRYHATPEIRVDCPDDVKFEVVASLREHFRATHPVVDLDGARIDFEEGWGLVRASNTQPVLVVRAEGKTPAGRDRILRELSAELSRRGVRLPESACPP
jgi:phosphomannomutase/phosphoglucomutase